MSLNLADIHFWVERNGMIIDPEFIAWENMVKKINNLEGKKIYQSLNDKETIKKYLKYQISIFDVRTMNILKDQPMNRQCYINSLNEIKKNGGKLKVGKLGWKIRNKDDIWWEYG